jgi:hypothetical protein
MTIDPKTAAVVLIEYQNFWAFVAESCDGCATQVQVRATGMTVTKSLR